jgi:predicted ABC-type ATPase
MANLYIIAGCNGAGKTTASNTVLPEIIHCNEFVNADSIAKGLSPFQPETVAFEAGRIMLHRIDELLHQQKDFAIETTLTTKSYLQTIQFARAKGYQITLLFFWLNNVELAKKRVQRRVSEGGHNIPVDVIERRYQRGIDNFFNHFAFAVDKWYLFENSEINPIFVAEKQPDSDLIIYEPIIFNQIRNGK